MVRRQRPISPEWFKGGINFVLLEGLWKYQQGTDYAIILFQLYNWTNQWIWIYFNSLCVYTIFIIAFFIDLLFIFILVCWLVGSVRLPGQAYIGGLWPAMWMMGNLARATYVGSSNNIWYKHLIY